MDTFTIQELRGHYAAQLERSPRSKAVAAAVDKSFVQIGRHRYIRRSEAKKPGYRQAFHPPGWHYPADLRTRSLAHLMDHPEWVADSWSAAALLGIYRR